MVGWDSLYTHDSALTLTNVSLTNTQISVMTAPYLSLCTLESLGVYRLYTWRAGGFIHLFNPERRSS